jgi:hypothetical protein
MVTVVSGARGAALESLLAEHDRLLLVHRSDRDASLLAMARAELEALGPPTAVLELPRSPGAAALARSGTALAAPLRAAFRGAVGTG